MEKIKCDYFLDLKPNYKDMAILYFETLSECSNNASKDKICKKIYLASKSNSECPLLSSILKVEKSEEPLFFKFESN